MKRKRVVVWVFAVVAGINLPLWDFFTKPAYSYRNADGSFRFTEEAGSSFSEVERVYGYFLCRHEELNLKDNKLYREFTMKPWAFWQWRELVFHSERFMLTYRTD